MKNIKIGPKLTISFLILTALTASMGIYMIVALKKMEKADTVLYEKAIIPLGFLSETGYLAQEIKSTRAQTNSPEWQAI